MDRRKRCIQRPRARKPGGARRSHSTEEGSKAGGRAEEARSQEPRSQAEGLVRSASVQDMQKPTWKLARWHAVGGAESSLNERSICQHLLVHDTMIRHVMRDIGGEMVFHRVLTLPALDAYEFSASV